MQQGVLETFIGFVVIIITTVFFLYAYNVSDAAKPSGGYVICANFENIEGLNVGSDVKLSGIKIGYVESITLENKTFFAKVDLRINQDIKIPEDSRVIVSTSGLIGNKYIRINPGASDETITAGEKFKFTQSALNIEDLIAKLMYSITSK